MPQTQSAQMSASDRKKKEQRLLKKGRAKKRAFRAKKALSLDTASAVANFQGKQVQVKQASKTSGEIYSEVYTNTARQQGIQSEKDRLSAALEIQQAYKENADAAIDVMDVFRKKADEHKKAVTQELINSAGNVNKLLNGLFEGLSDDKKNNAESAAKAVIESGEAKRALQTELADARAKGDVNRLKELEGKLDNLDKDMKAAIEDAGKDLEKGLKDINTAVEKENNLLGDLEQKIKELEESFNKGTKAFSDAVGDIIKNLEDNLPGLKDEPHWPIYWCFNMINGCRKAEDKPSVAVSSTDKNNCILMDVTDYGTGITKPTPRPHFCHEDDIRIPTPDFTGDNFSKLHSCPQSLISRIMSRDTEMTLGAFHKNEVEQISVRKGRQNYYKNILCPEGKNPALKIFYPGELGADLDKQNKKLRDIIAEETAWLMTNYKKQ